MGQMYFTFNNTKKQPHMPTISRELTQSGHKFTIEEGCMLKMEVKENVNKRCTSRCIVAAFDMDQTLITTKSGLKFGKNGHDWKFLPHTTTHLRAKLRQLAEHHPEHRVVVVIFTNQNGCLPKFSGKSLQYLRTKLIGIADALPVFDYAFAAMKAPTPELKAKYRKPGAGMFEHLKGILNMEIDMDLSFYVGDAAGRPQDHSADDQGFAANAGLKFYAPEDYFIGVKPIDPVEESGEANAVASSSGAHEQSTESNVMHEWVSESNRAHEQITESRVLH